MLRSMLFIPVFVAVLTLNAVAAILNDYNPYDYNIPDNCSNVNSDLLLSGAPSDAQIFTMTHSVQGWMTSFSGPNDVITKFHYDSFGKLIEVVDNQGIITSTQVQHEGKR